MHPGGKVLAADHQDVMFWYVAATANTRQVRSWKPKPQLAALSPCSTPRQCQRRNPRQADFRKVRRIDAMVTGQCKTIRPPRKRPGLAGALHPRTIKARTCRAFAPEKSCGPSPSRLRRAGAPSRANCSNSDNGWSGIDPSSFVLALAAYRARHLPRRPDQCRDQGRLCDRFD